MYLLGYIWVLQSALINLVAVSLTSLFDFATFSFEDGTQWFLPLSVCQEFIKDKKRLCVVLRVFCVWFEGFLFVVVFLCFVVPVWSFEHSH